MGVAAGALYVLLTVRQIIWCWPAGLVSAALLHRRVPARPLYGATALQGVYVALMLYGWYEWLHGGGSGGRLAVSRTPRLWWLGLGLAGGGASRSTLGLFLRSHTDAALPFWDAGTTSFSLVAQWMTTRKWIENWLVWIAVDVVYVGMYVVPGALPDGGAVRGLSRPGGARATRVAAVARRSRRRSRPSEHDGLRASRGSS